MNELTERQRRELEYHRQHAGEHWKVLEAPFSWDVLNRPGRRWWNAYWTMFACLEGLDLVGKRVLVVGCGFGDDALRLAKLGASVSAFDLSPESLEIAAALAARENLAIDFREMPAERLEYADSTFDCVVARDILHHVDIPAAMTELVRVAKPDARIVVNEIYSHSITDRIRHSAIVERFLYPRMRAFVYGSDQVYITEDERKLTERDIQVIKAHLGASDFSGYFNFIVARLVPDRFEWVARVDRVLLRVLGPLGALLGGRILFNARVRKPAPDLGP